MNKIDIKYYEQVTTILLIILCGSLAVASIALTIKSLIGL